MSSYVAAAPRKYSSKWPPALWALTLSGLALTAYATWHSWQSELDGYRASYLAAADNRLLAVEHGSHELLTNLRGIAFALQQDDAGGLPALAQAFIPPSYQRGEIALLDASAVKLDSVCLHACPPGDGLLQRGEVRQIVESSLRAGEPRVGAPIPAPPRSEKYTTWLALAIPVSRDHTLLALVDSFDLVESSLSYLRPGGVDVYLFDETEQHSLAYFHRSRKSTSPAHTDPLHPGWSADHHTGSFEIGGRRWAVHNEPVQPLLAQTGWTPWGFCLAGVFLTATVTFALGAQIHRRLSVEREVERRTRSLHQANQKLHQEIEQHQRTQQDLGLARDAAMESSRLKSAFLANVSHEIRTPLNGISGFASILAESSLDPEQREHASTIVTCASDLAALIDDILDMSRIEAGKMQLHPGPADLHRLISDCGASIQPQADAKGLHIHIDVHPSVPRHVIADEGRIKQILRNLLTNAVKFTDNGTVRLSCTAGSVQSPIRFEVRDTGRGIPFDVRDRLFKRFSQVDGSFQRVHGGLGLGLAITRELVDLMGGRIGVESEPGQGSLFWVQLPLPVLTPEYA